MSKSKTPLPFADELNIAKERAEEKLDQLIDLTFLKEESFGDHEMLTFLIQTFITNFEAFLTDTKTGIKEQDFETVYKAAHKIKPNVSMIGAEELKHKINLIHDLSKEKKDLQEISTLLTVSEKIFGKVLTALQHKIKELKNGN